MGESIFRVIRDFQKILYKKVGKQSFECLAKEVLSEGIDQNEENSDKEEQKKGVNPVLDNEEDINALYGIEKIRDDMLKEKLKRTYAREG